MKLIIGLGNPGKKFENTRHNIGFDVIDLFAQKHMLSFNNKFNAFICKTKDYIIAKPQTFMNNSGESVKDIMQFYKIDIKNILIIFDDATLELGIIRTKSNGSSGGQNGVKNIIMHLGQEEFWRTRLGIGHNIKYNISDWVISKFKKNEMDLKNQVLEISCKIIELFIQDQRLEIMNRYN